MFYFEIYFVFDNFYDSDSDFVFAFIQYEGTNLTFTNELHLRTGQKKYTYVTGSSSDGSTNKKKRKVRIWTSQITQLTAGVR